MENSQLITTPNQPLVLLGASVRQLAELLNDSQFKCVGFDMFADRDTRRFCSSYKISHYHQVLNWPEILRQSVGVIYSGGMENQPDLVEQIATSTQIMGCSSFCLKACRDPGLFRAIIERTGVNAGVKAPEIRSKLLPSDSLSDWICKNRESTGGNGVRNLQTGFHLGSGDYLQKRISGPSYSAVFVAGKYETQLIGVTKQLVGRPELGAGSFAYYGSIGPIALDKQQAISLSQLGAAVATEFGIRGVFGIDYSIAEDCIWPYDLNPRFPASGEIVAQALKHPGDLLRLHLEAFGIAESSPPRIEQSYHQPPFGKLVLFNRLPTSLEFTDIIHQQLHEKLHEPGFNASQTGFRLADIPTNRTIIKHGQPILTLISTHGSRQVEAELLQIAQLIYQIVEADSKSSLAG